MAGRPMRRQREYYLDEGKALVPADQLVRLLPSDWAVRTEAQRLQSMWGHSLTIGMEVLCWGPLRGLTPAELTLIDRVRHDTMLVCLRLGLAQLKSENNEDARELRDAISRFGEHEGQRYDLAK